MDHLSTNDRQLTRYLLGQMSEVDQATIEERFLGDGDFYEQLLIAEDELRVAYARDQLSPTEREQFEKRFLVFPDERLRLGLAEMTMEELDKMSVKAHREPVVQSMWSSFKSLFDLRLPAQRFAIGLILIAGLVALSWFSFRVYRQSKQDSSLQAKDQTPSQSVPGPKEQPSEQPTKPTEGEVSQGQTAGQARPSESIMTLALTAGRVRSGGDTATLNLTNETKEVRLVLKLTANADYPTYSVEIANSDGNQVFARRNLRLNKRTGEPTVVVQVPARVIQVDDYEVTLKAVTGTGEAQLVGDYYFTVRKK